MRKIVLKSYAKINLTLDVIGKKENGYHDLDMIMQTINIYDTITFEKKENNKIEILTNNNRLQNEDMKTNIIYKCIEKTFDYCNYRGNRGIKVQLDKVIPLEAGLAGGSSNGATAIKAINELYKFNLSIDEMIEIGKEIGADIPFCIVGGTARVRGIGDEIQTLKNHMKTNILLVKPEVSVSTKYVFENLNISNIKVRPKTNILIEAIENDELNIIAQNLCNTLEVVTTKKYGIIKEIKDFMLKNKSIGAIMTGSGSAVFGYFENEELLKKCTKSLNSEFKNILIFETSTINNFKG